MSKKTTKKETKPEVIKKSTGMKENRGDLDLAKARNWGLYLQGFLAVCSAVAAVYAIFDQEQMKFLDITLGLTILSMAYNNYTRYKRKGMTIAYIVVGLLLIGYGIMEFVK